MNDDKKYWDFCELAEVKLLREQLIAGLIHPIEYANAILILGERNGLDCSYL